MLARIIERLSTIDKLPVEVTDVRDVIIGSGIQDKIIFCPDNKMDCRKLLGAYYQYTTRPTIYGDPQFVSLIVFSSNQDVDWQRMICCKEMVHILDDEAEKTNTVEELDGSSLGFLDH